MVVFLEQGKTISILGAGSLGTAVIEALLEKGHQKIIATRRNPEKIIELKQKYEIEVTDSNQYAVRNSEVVVLTVKPYLLDQVCQEISDYAKDKLVISLAAAKSIAGIENILEEARVGRVMTGISVSEEIAAYTLGLRCLQNDVEVIRYIFGDSAKEVKEEALAERTWIACDTGLIAKGIARKISSLELLKEADARLMYAATLEGIAQSLRAGRNGDEIYDLVAGPGSFTGKLHQFLEEKGAYELMKECVERTVTACK